MHNTSKSTAHFSVSDRKLGDEWENWQGDLNGSVTQSKAGKRIFMGVLLVTWLFTCTFSAFILYLIAPRLSQFYINLPLIIGLTAGFFCLAMGLWFAMMALSLLTNRDFLFHVKGKTFSLTFLIPVAFRLGKRLGISKDRLSNSFVNVSNILIRLRVRKIQAEELLILLPRCLHPELLKQILKVAETLNIPTFTVSGGSKARKLIIERRPKAIIGVACERDLLSGLQDVLDKLPVIGIPNLRPEGPCKNTQIDWKEFEKALITFLDDDKTIRALCSDP